MLGRTIHSRHITLALAASLFSLTAITSEQKAPKLTRLSLDDCVARALKGSHRIAAEISKVEQVKSQEKQLLWAPFSNFKLGGVFSFVPDRCMDENPNATSGTLECSGKSASDDTDWFTQPWGPTVHVNIEGGIPVFTFGKWSNAREALGEARLAKEEMLGQVRSTVRLQTERAYQAISGAREMLYTLEQGQKHLDKARKKVESDLENQDGTSTELDLVKLKVFRSELDHMRSQVVEIEQTALAALHFLVGAGSNEHIDILDAPQSQMEAPVLELPLYKNTALKHRPELAALRHAVRATEAKVDMRKSDFAPDLVLFASAFYGYTPGRTDIQNWALKDSYNYGPGFAVGLALSYKLDFGLDHHRLQETKAELAAVTHEQKAALGGVMLEVEKTYHHLRAVEDGLKALGKAKRLVKGWIMAAVQNQQIGVGSVKDVRDALKEYFQVMANLHKLTHDYNVGLAEMTRVTGQRVSIAE